MKTIKITLVVVLLAALGLGIYFLLKPDSTPPIPDNPVILPSNCDKSSMLWNKNYIDSVFALIPIKDFDSLISTRSRLDKSFDDVMKNSAPECQKTVSLYVMDGERIRFCAMAENEFNGKVWGNYKTITSLSNSLLADYSANASSINKKNTEVIKSTLNQYLNLCNQYQSLVNYNSRVNKQANQRPENYYDRWNFSNTQNLIDNTPSPKSDTVKNTTPYEDSRSSVVKDRLYRGHIAFLEQLVSLAKTEVEYRPDDKNTIIDRVSSEIYDFYNRSQSLYGKNSYNKYNELNNSLPK